MTGTLNLDGEYGLVEQQESGTWVLAARDDIVQDSASETWTLADGASAVATVGGGEGTAPDAEEVVGIVAGALDEDGAASVGYDDAAGVITISATDTQLDPSTIAAGDLGFDPATQAELDSHTGTSDAHHSPTQSADIDHGEVSNVRSYQHHSKTTSASGLSDVSPDSAADAHHTKTPEYSDDDARTAVEGNTDVADLSGGQGSSGQVPQTDGTGVSWVDASIGGGYTDEQAHDAVDALLDAGANVQLSYDDPNDVLTISATDTDTNTQLSDSDVVDAVEGNGSKLSADVDTVDGYDIQVGGSEPSDDSTIWFDTS